MAILKVARLGHPVLRERASDVEVEDIRKGRFDSLIQDMFETMTAYEGVGLAGPQVHLPLRIFVFAVPEDTAARKGVDALKPGAFFNATLEGSSSGEAVDWEGCLSVPFLGGRVPRASEVTLRGIDPRGNRAEVTVRGYAARIFQHEVDHTDGHVYLDRMADLRSLAYTIIL